jgi:hypothetical protein
MAPSGGGERPRRKVRFARLIHAARPRSWRTYGPRRLACLLLRVVEEATAFPPAAVTRSLVGKRLTVLT